jgi:hypothetical protein
MNLDQTAAGSQNTGKTMFLCYTQPINKEKHVFGPDFNYYLFFNVFIPLF